MSGQGAPMYSERERSLYGSLWAQADMAGQGRLGGVQAVNFLSKSGLDRGVLKRIWDIADAAGHGALGPEEFSVALRLVAHAQSGHAVSPELVVELPPGLPRFETPFATSLSRGRSPGDRLMPTPRDLRKYGRLFMQSGGPMERDRAMPLLARSGLDHPELQGIWQLADTDRDGRLDWREFVVAMHLVRRLRAGQPLPPSVPVDLRNLVSSLAPAESYAAEASRSPRALSTASARSLFDSASVGRTSSPLGAEPAWEPCRAEGPPWGEAGDPAPREPPGGQSSLDFAPPDSPGASGAREGLSPDFGAPENIRGLGLGEDAQPTEHLQALVDVERKLVAKLRLDTNDLSEDLARLEDSRRAEESEAERESMECDRMGQERRHVEQQLEAARRELGELKSEHEALHFESVLLRRDRSHYGDEVSFLERLYEEGTRDAEALQQSVEYLEQLNESVSAHTRALDEARRGIVERLRAERDLLRREEAETRSARRALDALRGGALGLARGDGLAPLDGPEASGPEVCLAQPGRRAPMLLREGV